MSNVQTQNIETADVIVVGAGMAGSVMAYQLGLAGLKVLVLESGPAIPPNRSEYLERFYTAVLKAPESPYPPEQSEQTPATQFAPRATIQDLITAGSQDPNKAQKSYLVQKGPHLFASTYERVGGGTMWHWMGTALRLLPRRPSSTSAPSTISRPRSAAPRLTDDGRFGNRKPGHASRPGGSGWMAC